MVSHIIRFLKLQFHYFAYGAKSFVKDFKEDWEKTKNGDGKVK